MTRAEEAAINAYPVLMKQGFQAIHDVNLLTRRGFIKGYEQAEKDLALTADDIETMCRIRTALLIENYHLFDGTDNRKLYEEVLIKFNESKRK